MRKNQRKIKKSLHIVLLMLVIALLHFCVSGIDCYAVGEGEADGVGSEIDEIIDDFYNAVPESVMGETDSGGLVESLGIKSVLARALSLLSGQSTEAVSLILSIVGVSVISALVTLMSSDISAAVSRAVGVVASAMMLERLFFVFEGISHSLREVSDFFAAVIPVTLAVNSLGVSPATASTQAVGMGVTLSAYSFISKSLLIPVVSAIFVSSAASSIDPLFDRIAKGIKGVFLSLMGIFTVLVGATFSLQSVIAVSNDSLLMRSARYAVAGSIPVVGNAVSGALGLVSGGVAYARGIVGGGAIAVVIALVLSPLITLLVYRLCLKIGIFISSVFSSSGCNLVMSSFLGSLDSLIGAYSLCALIYVVELIAFLKGGVGVA